MFATIEARAAFDVLAAHMRDRSATDWSAVTYLPFLWQPDTHMLLTPEIATKFAALVGHPFAGIYREDLDFAVYESLRDLVAGMKGRVGRPEAQGQFLMSMSSCPS